MIYFIRAEETPYIKIGYTEDLYRRMIKMQADCPVKLLVLKTIEGDKNYEKDIHKKFAAFHYRGEWFKLNEKLIEDLTIPRDNEELWVKLESIVSKGIYPSSKVLFENFSRLEKKYLKLDSKRIKTLCIKYLGTSQEALYKRLLHIHELLKTHKRHKIAGVLGLKPQTYRYLRERYDILVKNL